MAKEAVISVASSSFWFENLRAPKKKLIKLAVGDVLDPPSEFVLRSLAVTQAESQLRYLTTTWNPFSFDTTTSQVGFSFKKQSFRFS